MKQFELAEKLGVAVVTIGQYERNQRQPRYDQLQRIAKALGTTVTNLLPPDIYWEDEDGVGHTELPIDPRQVLEDRALSPGRHKTVEISSPELEEMLGKFRDGEPLLLSQDEMIKFKSLPKEQIIAALNDAQDRLPRPRIW